MFEWSERGVRGFGGDRLYANAMSDQADDLRALVKLSTQPAARHDPSCHADLVASPMRTPRFGSVAARIARSAKVIPRCRLIFAGCLARPRYLNAARATITQLFSSRKVDARPRAKN